MDAPIHLVLCVSPSVHDDEKFYLKHTDDKGDHILVDEHFNITDIIDSDDSGLRLLLTRHEVSSIL